VLRYGSRWTRRHEGVEIEQHIPCRIGVTQYRRAIQSMGMYHNIPNQIQDLGTAGCEINENTCT